MLLVPLWWSLDFGNRWRIQLWKENIFFSSLILIELHVLVKRIQRLDAYIHIIQTETPPDSFPTISVLTCYKSNNFSFFRPLIWLYISASGGTRQWGIQERFRMLWGRGAEIRNGRVRVNQFRWGQIFVFRGGDGLIMRDSLNSFGTPWASQDRETSLYSPLIISNGFWLISAYNSKNFRISNEFNSSMYIIIHVQSVLYADANILAKHVC